MASLYKSLGRYSEAEPLYIQALEIAEKVLGVNHPNTVTYRENLEDLRKKRYSLPGVRYLLNLLSWLPWRLGGFFLRILLTRRE